MSNYVVKVKLTRKLVESIEFEIPFGTPSSPEKVATKELMDLMLKVNFSKIIISALEPGDKEYCEFKLENLPQYGLEFKELYTLGPDGQPQLILSNTC